MTWATRITILRLVLIPVFVGSVFTYHDSVVDGSPQEAWRYLAIAAFLVAALSDALDGYLARHWNQASALGALLDPIADKSLLLAVLLSLGFIPLDQPRSFPVWFPVIIISRDALLMIGYFILRHFRHHIEIRPHWTGKLSTFFTLAAICAVLFKLKPAILPLCGLGAAFAVACTAIYVRAGLRMLGHSGHAHPEGAR